MFAFYLVWPYIGLGAALLLALLLTTDALRSDLTVSRWYDLVWLAWLGTLAYLIHQFEEHGIDALGATYAFRAEMCRNFGFPDVQACPLPFSFVTAVNISVVWVFGPATALLGRRRPELALAFFSVPFANTLMHVGPAVALGCSPASQLSDDEKDEGRIDHLDRVEHEHVQAAGDEDGGGGDHDHMIDDPGDEGGDDGAPAQPVAGEGDVENP